jgi:hypothetical protein
VNDWMVEGAAVERVHAGVMGRIRRRRNVRRGAVVAALLALAFVRMPEDVELLSLTLPKPPAAPVWVAPVPATSVVLAKAAPRPAERIIIFTDDPNVVIVLVGEGGEE